MTFWLLDASNPDRAGELQELLDSSARNVIAVWNKIDLVPDFVMPELDLPQTALSAVTGEGIDNLIEKFSQIINAGSVQQTLPDVAVNARIAGELEEAVAALITARMNFESSEYELAAAELAAITEIIAACCATTVAMEL